MPSSPPPIPKKYLLVIHSGEARYPLLEAGEKLQTLGVAATIGDDFDPIKVNTPALVEYQLSRAGNGTNPQHDNRVVWEEILERHKAGQEIGAILGCPIITADIMRHLKEAGIPVPKDVGLFTMTGAEDYAVLDAEHPSIAKLVAECPSFPLSESVEGCDGSANRAQLTDMIVEKIAEFSGVSVSQLPKGRPISPSGNQPQPVVPAGARPKDDFTIPR